MKSFIRLSVIASLLCAAIVAPLASAVASDSFSKPARFESEVAVIAQDRASLIECDELTVTAAPPAKARFAAPKASAKPVVYHSLSVTELEQGGRPGAGSVIRWD